MIENLLKIEPQQAEAIAKWLAEREPSAGGDIIFEMPPEWRDALVHLVRALPYAQPGHDRVASIATLIHRHVHSEADPHFVDRRHLAGVADAAAAIARLEAVEIQRKIEELHARLDIVEATHESKEHTQQ